MNSDEISKLINSRDPVRNFNDCCKAFEILHESRFSTDENSGELIDIIFKNWNSSPLFLFNNEENQIINKAILEMNDKSHPVMPADSIILADSHNAVFITDVKDFDDSRSFICVVVDISYKTGNSEDKWFDIAFASVVTGNIDSINRKFVFPSGIISITGNLRENKVYGANVVDKNTVPLDLDFDMSKYHGKFEDICNSAIMRDFGSSITTAIDQLHYIDLPKHYIIEETPKHVANKKESKNKKLNRYQDRRRWRILDPTEIKRIWPKREHLGGTHASPVPHFRIGHNRTLRAEKWKAKRWQTIRVRPSWVGCEEWECDRAVYRVIHRRGSEEGQA